MAYQRLWLSKFTEACIDCCFCKAGAGSKVIPLWLGSQQNKKMPLNIPMVLTWVRILMIPLVVGVFFLPESLFPIETKNWLAAWFFILAAVTDALDGYLARRWNQTSSFGAFLDPVADKLMVGAALIMLVYLDRLGPMVALIIIGREITISALREWMAQIGASNSVAVNSLGKLTTCAELLA